MTTDLVSRFDDWLCGPDDVGDEPHLILCREDRSPALVEIAGTEYLIAWSLATPDDVVDAAASAIREAGYPGLRYVYTIPASALRYYATGVSVLRDAPISQRLIFYLNNTKNTVLLRN